MMTPSYSWSLATLATLVTRGRSRNSSQNILITITLRLTSDQKWTKLNILGVFILVRGTLDITETEEMSAVSKYY